MSWMANARYGVRPADGGLVLVQELINTKPVTDTPDLLAERADAQAWWDGTVRDWARVRGATAPAGDLSDADLAGLRALRSTFEEMLGTGQPTTGQPPTGTAGGVPTRGVPPRDVPMPDVPTPDVTAALVPDGAGLVRLMPTGQGWRWLASALWSEALLAQQAGTWSRLKLCHNDHCRTAFYDGSRNRSGVWHDVNTCGNSANLRAYRARRRTSAGGPADAQARNVE